MATQSLKTESVFHPELSNVVDSWLPGIAPDYFGWVPDGSTRGRAGACIARESLYRRYQDKLIVNPELTRSLVSFQSNKCTPFYRWFKYKEAFSHDFVHYILERFRKKGGRQPRLLDPFAGAGTALTSAATYGWHATGVELLPVPLEIIRARLMAERVDHEAFRREIARLRRRHLLAGSSGNHSFPHLRITTGAFPAGTETALSGFMSFLDTVSDRRVRELFRFAALSVLEEVSYTRKDGQYLRWDARADRHLKSSFNKGAIPTFEDALFRKLQIMSEDLLARERVAFSGSVKLVEGSSLELLPELPDACFDLVCTSPPYCNRYDYTRTYALELAFLGYGEEAVSRLRQLLLSATVENKTKRDFLRSAYEKMGQLSRFRRACQVFENQAALHEILQILYNARGKGELNNSNIPGMVENYFFEMNLVVREIARTLAPGGRIVMVNDNVQYHGEEVPVDLILTDFAESAGLELAAIWVLARGKGNSSQQMGVHGRRELRKCIYVWSKP